MEKPFDTIIVGMGAMGSAATYQLAQSGNRVLGIDQFSPPHSKGSSHGDTRITRLAIGEGEQYVPFALRSHEIWRAIEHETRKNLLTTTGGLMIGSESAPASHGAMNFVERTRQTAEKYGIEHETLDAKDIRKRFPPFAVRDNEFAYYEHEAGFLRPEACVQAQLELAEKYKAVLHTHERVLEVLPRSSGDSVQVRTDRGTYEAEKAVLTVGPWIKDFLPEKFAKQFTVYREVLYWFDSKNGIDQFSPEKFPIFVWVSDRDTDVLYGFPAIDGKNGGVKVATEQFTVSTTPQTFKEEVSPDEIETMQEHTKQYIPSLDGKCIKSASCKYTCTPDFGFVIDALPDHPQIIVASPCSGHGFKHSAAIGESISQLVTDGKSALDTSMFTFKRFE
jgi:sarcosine oxidase